jgi:predicted hotdog family 3-hydroxylacyl-ACP dehydratase
MTGIDREKIATLIPHAGTMCLLDAVVRWDATSIRCRTSCHRRTDNPLRRPNGVVGAICGVEIAAQAMAVHSRLIADATGQPTPGYLTNVRDVRLHAARLDHVIEDLLVDALLIAGDARGASYRFVVGGENGDLVSGRATVLFEIAAT